MKKSRKIAYTAVGAAVSSVCVFLTNIVPLRVSLLMFAALCYYIIFCKCGLLYGLMDIVVSLLITFFAGGITLLSPAFLLTAVVFAPFSLVSYFSRKLYYTSWKTALARIGISILFANVSLPLVWLLAKWITSIDIVASAAAVGGYVVLAIIYSALVVVFDFLFSQLAITLLKRVR